MTAVAPTRLVEADQVLAIAEGLVAWAERTVAAVESIRAYAASSASAVRARHEQTAIDVPEGVASMLAGSVTFTSPNAFAEYSDAAARGAFATTTRQVLENSRPS